MALEARPITTLWMSFDNLYFTGSRSSHQELEKFGSLALRVDVGDLSSHQSLVSPHPPSLAKCPYMDFSPLPSIS